MNFAVLLGSLAVTLGSEVPLHSNESKVTFVLYGRHSQLGMLGQTVFTEDNVLIKGTCSSNNIQKRVMMVHPSSPTDSLVRTEI